MLLKHCFPFTSINKAETSNRLHELLPGAFYCASSGRTLLVCRVYHEGNNEYVEEIPGNKLWSLLLCLLCSNNVCGGVVFF